MPSPIRPVVFLDDGGVMNDPVLRAPQWRKLLGEFMPPLLGGTPEQWAEANRVTFPRAWADMSSRMSEFSHHSDFQRELDLLWLRGMCEVIAIPMPTEDRALQIATAAATYITSRVRSEYPDAIPAIRTLHNAGFQLHTSSGTRSFELEGILGGMGVRDCFGHLFGPDLLDTVKGSPEYYRRVFQQAGVDPRDAVVVDDSQVVCEWAAAIGASYILVDRSGNTEHAAADLETAVAWLIEGRS